jgi:PIN domain nuclease of toxin-antitoxin system
MDKLEHYRQSIQALLTEYVATPISNGAIESQIIFDTQRDRLDAIDSTQLPGDFHKDPADRILVAIALHYDIPLVTCDEKILSYPHVETIW